MVLQSPIYTPGPLVACSIIVPAGWGWNIFASQPYIARQDTQQQSFIEVIVFGITIYRLAGIRIKHSDNRPDGLNDCPPDNQGIPSGGTLFFSAAV
jgi:hypothetical protein